MQRNMQVKGGVMRYANTTDEFKEDDLVCHCFEYTRRDIEQDYRDNGRSTIFERINSEKKAGTCGCSKKNPKGC
jgi:hypothetical protein